MRWAIRSYHPFDLLQQTRLVSIKKSLDQTKSVHIAHPRRQDLQAKNLAPQIQQNPKMEFSHILPSHYKKKAPLEHVPGGSIGLEAKTFPATGERAIIVPGDSSSVLGPNSWEVHEAKKGCYLAHHIWDSEWRNYDVPSQFAFIRLRSLTGTVLIRCELVCGWGRIQQTSHQCYQKCIYYEGKDEGHHSLYFPTVTYLFRLAHVFGPSNTSPQ